MQPNLISWISPPDDPDYPSRDGKPMSDNMLQFRWITTIQGGLDALFLDNPLVVVAGDCLWYPVEGDNTIRVAPDTMVIFGRPKGDRGSYIQHREEGIPVQVVFEVLSPGNRAAEMRRKLAFYENYGVEEYYILDPDFARHKGYRRAGDKLVPIPDLFGWTSPRLGIRFEMTKVMKKTLRIFTPEGRLFEPYTDIARKLDVSERQIEEEREKADEATLRADEATLRADEATLRADEERLRADQERLRAERLLARLRALGMEPEA